MAPEDALAGLDASSNGLSSEEATKRLVQYGPNALREGKTVHPITILLGQFTSFVVWLLIGAGIVSGALGEWIDAVAILAIVVLNAIIGFYQEYSAERAIAALKKMTAPHAKVRRDGQVVSLAAVDVVPGDVVELEAGDLIPADARLLEAASLKAVEAALTGESDAVTKDVSLVAEVDTPLGNRKNLVFMGTSIAAGSGRAVVVATGMATEFGRIADLLEDAGREEGTPLQKRLQSVGRMLVWASLAIVALVFFLGLLRGIELAELFVTSVSLAVAAVPEGLPAVVTVSLALGVQRMARRRALVRKLPAVETLGSANVICTDKTGTLTVGEMTVRELYVAGETFAATGEGYGPGGEVLTDGAPLGAQQAENVDTLLTVLVGCNGANLSSEGDVWSVVGDPTEGALLAAGLKRRIDKGSIEASHPKVSEIPFDSDRKRMTVVRKLPDGSLRAMVKGAPDILLERCTHILASDGVRPITDDDRSAVSDRIAEMASGALRVLAAGYRTTKASELEDPQADTFERDLVFVGLVGMHDPPRPEAKDAVAKCHRAGIRVVMITGDHPHTALAVARELGIATGEDASISGKELDGLSDKALRQMVEKVAVYARVTAEHKLRIVRAWRAEGGIVAMTGDGVNDAPAIKGADIGIAMGRSGTEVTKEASDMVITDDNFASIVAAVEEGRGVYDNIKKTLLYLLAGNFGELLLMTAALVAGLPVPLLAIHLLWINLVTDGLPALALATDPIDPEVMNRPPRSGKGSFTDRRFFTAMVFTGILDASVAMGAYLYGLQYDNLEMARTFAFAALVYVEILRSFSYRSETRPIWEVGFFSNFKLGAIAVVAIAFQPWSHHMEFLGTFLKSSSVPWSECLALLAVGAIPLLILETLKVIRRNRANRLLPATA